MRRISGLLVSAAVVATVVATGLATGVVEPDDDTPSVLQPTATAVADNVLLISIDGLNPKALNELGRSKVPHFFRLMEGGAETSNARTLAEITQTLPNHTGMLTGVRSEKPGTGVLFNDDPGFTLVESSGRYIPSVFDVVHDHGGSTAMYVAKDKFKFLRRSWDGSHGARDTIGADDGRNKIDSFLFSENEEGPLVTRVVDDLRSRPADFTFLHLSAPDRVGHLYGGMSSRYLSAVRRMDHQLGRILRAIDDESLASSLRVILTADHGTNGLKHRDISKPANFRIPFMVWGAGVREGSSLYDLNPGRERPGLREQIGYGVTQPIRNADAANLALRTLGLPPVPGSEFNNPRKGAIRLKVR